MRKEKSGESKNDASNNQTTTLSGRSDATAEKRPAQPLSHNTMETDIGLYSRDQIASDHVKKHLPSSKWIPSADFCFPKTAKRGYNPCWENTYKWLRYSPSKDGAYCAVCFTFAPQSLFNTEFIAKPFRDWENARGEKRGSLNHHEGSNSHCDAMKLADNFLSITNRESQSISEYVSGLW